MTNRYDAIIFDLDGTLVDTAPDLRLALNRTLAELGRPPVDLNSVRNMIGDGVAKLVERGLATTGTVPGPKKLAALVSQFVRHYDLGLVIQSKLYPGVPETLEKLLSNDRHLGICTNKPFAQSVAILKELGIDKYFEVVIGGDSTDRRKPDPEPILKTLERMGAEPDTALFVGDSINDVESARRAGVASIIVSYGYLEADPKTLGATDVIKELSALQPALDQLESA